MKLKSIPHTLQHLTATAAATAAAIMPAIMAAIITTIIIATTTTACTNHLPGNLPPQGPHNPTTPLPPRVVPLTLHMPTQAPTFGTPQPEEPWTRSQGADAPGAVSIVSIDGAATTTRGGGVPGFTPDAEWKDGDEVMVRLMMACMDPSSGDPISTSMYAIFTTARYSAPGTTLGGTTGSWHLQVDANNTHYLHIDMINQQITTLTPAQLPLLYTDTETGTGTALGIRLPLDYQPAEVFCTFSIAYAPGLIWSPDPDIDENTAPQNYFITAPNPSIPLGTAPYWDIINESSGTIATGTDGTHTLTLNAATDEHSTPIEPTTDYTRLRIYVGSDMAGKPVTLQSYRFSYAYGIPGDGDNFTEKSTDGTYTYTATVDPTGNAYFYGTTRHDVSIGTGNGPLDGTCSPDNENKNDNDHRLIITLQGHPTTDGDHTILFQASPHAKIILGSGTLGATIPGVGQSLAINGAAVIKEKQLPSITIDSSLFGDDYNDPDKMSYNEYVAALVAAAKDGKTRWVIDAEKNTVRGWYSSILNGIEDALKNDDVKNLKIHIDLPKFTDDIPNNAFNSRTALASISLPAATTLRDLTFYGCTALTSVHLPAATTFGFSTFYGCTALTSISLPKATTLSHNTFGGCTALTSVSLPAATTFGYRTFQNCTALTSISLPAATTLDYNTFDGCTALTSVSLPAATTFGDDTFQNCTALTSVTLPKATKFGEGTFYGCTSLASISLPKATKFGEGTFYGCTALTSISLMQTGAWVSLRHNLFSNFTPTSACTVQVAAGTRFNTVTTDNGKTSWAPTKEDGTTAINGSGSTYPAFTSGSDSPKVHSNITFEAVAVAP